MRIVNKLRPGSEYTYLAPPFNRRLTVANYAERDDDMAEVDDDAVLATDRFTAAKECLTSFNQPVVVVDDMKMPSFTVALTVEAYETLLAKWKRYRTFGCDDDLLYNQELVDSFMAYCSRSNQAISHMTAWEWDFLVKVSDVVVESFSDVQKPGVMCHYFELNGVLYYRVSSRTDPGQKPTYVKLVPNKYAAYSRETSPHFFEAIDPLVTSFGLNTRWMSEGVVIQLVIEINSGNRVVSEVLKGLNIHVFMTLEDVVHAVNAAVSRQT